VESSSDRVAVLRAGDKSVALRLRIAHEDGSAAVVSVQRVTVEHRGPLRTVVRFNGVTQQHGRPLLDVIGRLHLVANHRMLRCDLTLRNPCAATHPNGHWDLGDAGSVFLRSVTLHIDRESPYVSSSIDCSPEPGAPLDAWAVPLTLHQESSGGAHWRSPNHVNRRRQIPLRYSGYQLRSGDVTRESARATPIVALGSGDARVATTMEHFWQTFPKAVSSDGRSIQWHLLPSECADVHELQGGEQTTSTIHISVGPDTVSQIPLDCVRQPFVAVVDPAYMASTGAVPYLVAEADDPGRDYVALVRAAIEGADTFAAKREVIDEYGWRHFGDVYGDHEAVRHKGPTPLVSHYNNQYDAIFGFATQFLRTADPRWWSMMRELAQHVTDIDIYHTDRDKAAYNRGLFWHTIHYIDADTATHRTYPATCGHGGGPANEHNYVSGLQLAWYLTGEVAFREAAIDLAAFPIRMDDGSLTVFRWLAGGDTGLATSSGQPHYHGPGRGSGNSLSVLVDGYQLTGDRQFLEKAEQIIRRAIHPSDDIARHDLLDAERKWFYTMFLQALGKYLDAKADWGQIDFMYAWGEASLLHYARWMAEHEYPYLDKQEILEFPTETWAAQDIRKSDVFHYAEKHSRDPVERARFRERATFFFRSSIETLTAAPTRTLARPVIVLLSSGRLHAWFSEHADASAPSGPEVTGGFGVPQPFEPQKVRALRRVRMLVATALLTGVLGLSMLALRLL
jgi:hypothetical protein